MKHELLICKARRIDTGEWIQGFVLQVYTESSNFQEIGYAINSVQNVGGDCLACVDDEVIPETICRFTGCETTEKFFEDDLISNNFGTDKEVVRRIVFKEGTFFAIRISGESRMPDELPLGDIFRMNYRVIKNIHDKPAQQ